MLIICGGSKLARSSNCLFSFALLFALAGPSIPSGSVTSVVLKTVVGDSPGGRCRLCARRELKQKTKESVQRGKSPSKTTFSYSKTRRQFNTAFLAFKGAKRGLNVSDLINYKHLTKLFEKKGLQVMIGLSICAPRFADRQ